MSEVYRTILTELGDEKGTVLVEVPDLRIVTQGYGMADAIEMARDAIGLSIITKEDDGEEVPAPSAVELSASEFAGEGTQYLTFVDTDIAEYRRKHDNRAVRRNVTLPHWLNTEAEKAHVNVSRILQEALIAELQINR